MITYLFILFILFSGCAIAFKKEVMGQYRMTTVLIMFIGSYVLYTIASGIISKNYPEHRVVYNSGLLTDNLLTQTSEGDIVASIGYKPKTKSVYLHADDSWYFTSVNIKFLAPGDTIARYEFSQLERDIDSYLWVMDIGLPWADVERNLFIPTNDANIEIVKYIFSNHLIKDDEKIN